jgi:pyruvate dehydrogenase E1 component beta subunit
VHDDPGLKVVAPSNPRDVVGLLAAAVRDPDPVIFFEHKALYAAKGEVEDGEIVDTLGSAKIVRPGKDATILALALMVPRALAAAEKLQAEHGINVEVIDVRSLVPIDTKTILASVARTSRLFTVEENPRLCGWGAELVSVVVDEAFYSLDGPPIRITTPHIPLPSADVWRIWLFPASSASPKPYASRFRPDDGMDARDTGERKSVARSAPASGDGHRTRWTSRYTPSSSLR